MCCTPSAQVIPPPPPVLCSPPGFLVYWLFVLGLVGCWLVDLWATEFGWRAGWLVSWCLGCGLVGFVDSFGEVYVCVGVWCSILCVA